MTAQPLSFAPEAPGHQPAASDLLAVIDLDAALLAQLLPGVAEREQRRKLRSVLAAAYQASLAQQSDRIETTDQTEVSRPGLCKIAELLADALQELGQRGAGLRPIHEVRRKRLWQSRLRWPHAALGTAALTRQIDHHFKARVALTAARMAWWQARLESGHPGLLLTVRAPEPSADRLELELLNKKGRSPFS